MEKAFEQAVALAEQAGYSAIADRLDRAVTDLRSQTYAIAVAGEFKTGKSTLINRVFLKEDLLFTDILEATAVPAEISYAPEKSLEIIPCPTELRSDDTGEEPAGGTGTAERISNPDAEMIRARTSADTPEARAELARKTALVKIRWPAPNLEGLTLFDTPGINTFNTAVISATYRIMPRADLVLFLTQAKQLSASEREFLSMGVFREGISRVMILIVHDSDADGLSGTEAESLKQGIRSQLENMGCGEVPVEMVDIRHRSATDAAAPASRFIDRILAPETAEGRKDAEIRVDDVIGNLLGETPVSPAPLSASGDGEAQGWGALADRLISYIRENIRPARREKAARVLKIQGETALARCAAELSAMRKTESERRDMLRELRAREAEIRLKHERLETAFRKDLLRIEAEYVDETVAAVRSVLLNYMAEVESCDSLGELQDRLKDARIYLKKDMEGAFVSAYRRMSEELAALAKTYGLKSSGLIQPFQDALIRDCDIDGGLISKIPPFAVIALDIMLFVRFGPFGPLADILIRVLAQYIPYLNRLLPAAIAAGAAKKKVRESLERISEETGRDLPEQVGTAYRELSENILKDWKNHTEDHLRSVRDSLEQTVERPADPARQDLLEDVRDQFQRIVAKAETALSEGE